MSRSKVPVEYQITVGRAGYTACVRIVRFVDCGGGDESRTVIAERTQATDAGVDVEDWILTIVHEFREMLELGPNKSASARSEGGQP